MLFCLVVYLESWENHGLFNLLFYENVLLLVLFLSRMSLTIIVTIENAITSWCSNPGQPSLSLWLSLISCPSDAVDLMCVLTGVSFQHLSSVRSG